MLARMLLYFLNATENRVYPYVRLFLKSMHLNMKVSKAQGPDIWHFELQFYTVFCFNVS